MNNHHQQNKRKTKKKNGNENSPPLSPHFSPILFVFSLILFGYASYLLMTNSKLFCIIFIVFIFTALFIPAWNYKMSFHTQMSFLLCQNILENLCSIKYNFEEGNFIYDHDVRKDMDKIFNLKKEKYVALSRVYK